MNKKKSNYTVSEPIYWEKLYNAESTGWDLGRSTPVFTAWLRDNPGDGQKVCILGAGYGHDAIEFARAGYTVVAVEFAPTPAGFLANRAAKLRLPVKVFGDDLFKLPKTYSNYFDLVVEYTTYCAIEPRRRGEYVDIVADILKADGNLLGLFFPLGKDMNVGPPFGVSRDEIRENFGSRFQIRLEQWPEESVETRRLREVLMHMEKR